MKLHSKIIGKGKPLLILHGFLGMSDNWKTLGNQFAEEGFEVHLIDQRNHGRSPHSEDFSYELMADDLNEYCQQHNLQKINLLGHSMGGKTAMLSATLFPELIDKLIVVDISPKYYAPHHEDILEGLSFLSHQKLTSRKTADEELSAYVPEISVRQFLLKNLYWKEKNKLGFRMNLERLIKNKNNIGQALPPGAQYKGDTLFIKGGNSNYIGAEDKGLLQEHFPSSSLVCIENTGHWVHAEAREEFFEIVLKFLKG